MSSPPSIYNGGGAASPRSMYGGESVYAGGQSIYKGQEGGLYVYIGGRKYRAVKIGNQIWMAENLDYKFQGLAVGSESWSSEPSAAYYNNDESRYGIDGTYKCGLLYNWYAAKYLEDHKTELLPSGWHVPTDAEWTALTGAVGADAGTKLKAVNKSVASGTWPTGWNGTDDYGFTVLPAGYYGNGFNNINYRARFWSSSEYSSDNAFNRRFNDESLVGRQNTNKINGYSVRLVKDST